MNNAERRPQAVAIIADDLTGALDSAVAFAGSGRHVVVARRPDALPEALATGADILAVNTASRELSRDRACATVGQVAMALDLNEIPVVMKKVDSRLKGHPGAETAALGATLRGRRVVVAPAIPGMGRVQLGGWLTGEGIERDIDIAALFEGTVDLPEIASDADLDSVVATAKRETFWVGARGLAFALSRALYGPQLAAPSALKPPAVFAIGSRDAITLAQMERLGGDVSLVAAPDGVVPASFPTSPITVISLADGGGGLSPASVGAAFADGVSALLEGHPPATLLACGGETADALLDRLGVAVLSVTAEIAPGLPLCRIDAPWGNADLITKSGGFGAPDLLQRIASGLAGRSAETTDGDC